MSPLGRKPIFPGVSLYSGDCPLSCIRPTTSRTAVRPRVIILLIGLPWLLYLALVVRGGFVSPMASHKPWGYFVLVGLSVLSTFVSLWSYSAGCTKEWKITAFTMILVRKLSALLPSSTIVQWGIVFLLLGGAYLLTQTRFERIETPAATFSGFDRM